MQADPELEEIGTVRSDRRSYRDSDVESGVDYVHAVVAVGAAGSSAATAGASPVSPEPEGPADPNDPSPEEPEDPEEPRDPNDPSPNHPPNVELELLQVLPVDGNDTYMVVVDASASTSHSAISSFVFDPGDGSGVTYTTGPDEPGMVHYYDLPGNYTVTATVTNDAGLSTTGSIDVEVRASIAVWQWGEGFQLVDRTKSAWGVDEDSIWLDDDGRARIAYMHTGNGALVNGWLDDHGATARIPFNLQALGGAWQNVISLASTANGTYVISRDGTEVFLGYFTTVDATQPVWTFPLENIQVDGIQYPQGVSPGPNGSALVYGVTQVPNVGRVGRVTAVSVTGAELWGENLYLDMSDEAADFSHTTNTVSVTTGSDDTVYVAVDASIWTSTRPLSSRDHVIFAAFTAGGSELWRSNVHLWDWHQDDPNAHGGRPGAFARSLAVSGDTLYALVRVPRGPLASHGTHGIDRLVQLIAVGATGGSELWTALHHSPGAYIEPIDLAAVGNGEAVALLQTNAPIFGKPVDGEGEAVLLRLGPTSSTPVWTRQVPYSGIDWECLSNTGHLTGLAAPSDGYLYLMGFLPESVALEAQPKCPNVSDAWYPVVWRYRQDGEF